jgi:hypothetical protein
VKPRLYYAALSAFLTLAYLLLVGLAVATAATFIGGSTGFALGALLATLITWRLFYVLVEAMDA